MKPSASNLKKLLQRKAVTALLVTASVAAFATIGDGGGKKAQQKRTATRFHYTAKNFSLRSGYNFKGNNVLSTPPRQQFIVLHTTATYQKGNATYILPLKKKILLDKVSFKPAGK